MSADIPNTAPEQSDDEIDLLQLLRVVWVGKWWVALFAVLAAFVGVVNVLNTVPTYQSDALLQLEEKSGGLALPVGLEGLVDAQPVSETEIEIVKSRLTLAKVVAELNLDWSAQPKLAPVIGTLFARFDLPTPDYEVLEQYARPGDAIELGFLQVPPHWLGKGFELVVLGDDSFELILPDESRKQGRVGQMMVDESTGFSLEIRALTAPPGRIFELKQAHELSAIASLRSHLGVGEKGRKSGIISLTFKDSDPAVAKRILQAVIVSYVSQNLNRAAAEADSSLEFLEEQLPDVRAVVDTAEEALNSFMEAQGTINIDLESANLLTRITTVEAELTALLIEEDKLRERYTQNHPEYQLLLAQRQRLEERLTTLSDQVVALPETHRDIIKLTGELELAQAAYIAMLTRTQEIRVLRASSIGNVRIVDAAATAIRPVAPRGSMIVALALMLGLMLGLALVLIRHMRRNAIQSAQEIEGTGLPVFATINRSLLAEKHAKNRATRPILALVTPDALEIEAIRSLRSGLHFTMFDATNNALAITSAAPGAGKSFISTNLAVVAATAGQKVCLVDCDMRRGELYKSFDLRKHHAGLAEHLVGDLELEEALQDTKVEGLNFIPSGRYPPNPSELLENKNFANMLKKLEKKFDLIVLDCPPILAVTDAAVVGRAAGTLSFIVKYDITTMAELEASRRVLENAGTKINGVVLNAFDPKKARSSGTYSYNYRYDYKARK